MRKIFIFILLFTPFNLSFASNDLINNLKNISAGFKPECYDLHTTVDNNLFEKGITTYLTLNRGDVLVTQNNKVLPIKLSSQKDGVFNDYEFIFLGNNNDTDLELDYRNLKDGNSKTFLGLTLGLDNNKTNEIVLKFDKQVKDSSIFNFNYQSKYYRADYYISVDGNNYNRVSKNNITDFSFLYLKIIFEPISIYRGKTNYSEKIKINELSLKQDINTFLFMSFFDSPIDIYSSYNCKDTFNIYPNSFHGFRTDSETKNIEVYLTKNIVNNVFIEKDIDNDRVPDTKDNCKYIYNPRQLDSNANGIGDLCSDTDGDGIIGNRDNCIYLANSDQKDLNRNGVGDVCEFDKDEDGIFDSVDNCINDSNSDQKDTDKDTIGDICDNSIYYNPKQLDKNNNGIGDITEQKEKFLLENDEDKDKILDSIDNCKSVSNFNQLDTDRDGVGNACDNCLKIQNTNQLDENNNNIGDLCEDSDNDGITGLLDNCININNADQKDTDNNGIGDLCEDNDSDKILFANDNCPYDYNPKQKDVDEDNIGDKCDEKDDRYLESNRNLFIGIMAFITLLFFAGISIMLKKMGQSKAGNE